MRGWHPRMVMISVVPDRSEPVTKIGRSSKVTAIAVSPFASSLVGRRLYCRVQARADIFAPAQEGIALPPPLARHID